MHRRLLTPILTLLVLLAALPGALAAQTPVAPGSTWEATDVRTLESGDDQYVALSPDGTRIAGIGAEGGLCVWQVDDTTNACAEDVGPIRVESIAWAPDGSAVAFSLDHVQLLYESDIFVYEVADSALHNLTDDGHGGRSMPSEAGVLVDGVPAWSPDSRQLAFVRSQPSDETFGTVIMRIDRAGGEPVVVQRLSLEMPYGIFMPMHWLPGDTIVYTQASLNLADADDGVWRVGIDGSDARLLLPGGEGSDTPGALVMDVVPESGLALVYAAFLQGATDFEVPEAPQVWLLDIETAAATPVPNLPPASGEAPELAGRPQAAAFSPDGSAFIAVYSSVMQGTVLAATDVATGEVAILAEDVPARAGQALPTWSGDRFLLPERAQALLITLARADGASPAATPVASPVAAEGAWRIAGTREFDIEARAPVLSPDGTLLAGVGPEHTFCVWDVETLSPSCGGQELPIREETITWSPDGTAVAFALDAIRLAYESDIYVYEVATGELTNLTDDGIEGGLLEVLDAGSPIDDVPSWSPDSRVLVFVRSFWGDDALRTTTIMRIDRAGGDPTEVLPLDVEQPLAVWMPMHWLPDGTLLYAQSTPDPNDVGDGVWKVGVDDGSSPLQIAPGAEGTDIPGATIVDADAERGQAIVFSWLLAGQRGVAEDQALFWLVDIATGERRPFPALPDAGARPPVLIDATYSPDGTSILLVTLTEAGLDLMTMDPETLTLTPVDGEPLEVALQPGVALRWAANDTVLLYGPGGSVLVELEPAS